MKRFLIPGIILLVLAFAISSAYVWYQGKSGPAMISKVVIDNTVFIVDVADTPALRVRGLSGRPSLGENEGMLFIFPYPSIESFWMKDMNFALDMIWIGSDKRIVDITKNALPSSYPDTTFSPKEKAEYVLEVNAGAADSGGIKIGDTVRFE